MVIQRNSLQSSAIANSSKQPNDKAAGGEFLSLLQGAIQGGNQSAGAAGHLTAPLSPAGDAAVSGLQEQVGGIPGPDETASFNGILYPDQNSPLNWTLLSQQLTSLIALFNGEQQPFSLTGRESAILSALLSQFSGQLMNHGEVNSGLPFNQILEQLKLAGPTDQAVQQQSAKQALFQAFSQLEAAKAAGLQIPVAMGDKVKQLLSVVELKTMAGVTASPAGLDYPASFNRANGPALTAGNGQTAGLPFYSQGIDVSAQETVTNGTTSSQETQSQKVMYHQYQMPPMGSLISRPYSVMGGMLQQGQAGVTTMIEAGQFAKEIGSLIVNKLTFVKGDGVSQASIRLFPENLGQVDIKIITQNGQVTALFAAETVMGRDLIENQMAALRNALIQQGLQVDKLEVAQSALSSNSTFGGDKGQNMFQQQQQRQPDLPNRSENGAEFAGYETMNSEAEEISARVMWQTYAGQSAAIDYTA